LPLSHLGTPYQEPDGGAPPQATQQSQSSWRANLPLQLTTFIGRDLDVSELQDLLLTNRLVTLTGAGGVGKTRLAIRVAADLRERYSHGVCLVEFASLADAALVGETVASAIGLAETPTRPVVETLLDQLSEKNALLIFDNCEHIVQECAQLAETLLRGCPHLTLIATSREPLGIGGEVVWHVAPLSYPPSQSGVVGELLAYDAVQLFVERAAVVHRAFSLTSANSAAVCEICAHLDGIPLAIELAAARVNVLTPDQIAARVGDRFQLLTSGSRTSLPQHRTLRAAVDWSYDLLTEREKRLFTRLSVFAGSFTLEAAEAVCAGKDLAPELLVNLLAGLISKSLVTAFEHAGQMRYQLLETLRQYGAEKSVHDVGALQVQEQHCLWYLDLAERADRELAGPNQTRWLEQLEMEHPNLRTALGWCAADGKADLGLRLAGALGWFWDVRTHWREGRSLLGELLALPGAAELTAARAKALSALGRLAYRLVDLEAARAAYEASLGFYRQLDDLRGVGAQLRNLGLLAFLLADYGRASPLLRESLMLGRAAGDDWAVAFALAPLGFIFVCQGDVAASRAACDESLALNRKLSNGIIGEKWSGAMALIALGNAAYAEGDAAEAYRCYSMCVQTTIDAGKTWNLPFLLEAFGRLSAKVEPARAALLLGAAAHLRHELGTPVPAFWAPVHEEGLRAVRERLTSPAFESAFSDGWTMTPAQSLDIAHSYTPLADDPAEKPVAGTVSRARLGGLSAREWEVARLVADGRTNRQIAEALVVSERTAEHHVSHVLAKVGLNSRTQLALWTATRDRSLGDHIPASNEIGTAMGGSAHADSTTSG
jgi:predicted ATPase/DNA-binding CsgD family transcriptional regulator